MELLSRLFSKKKQADMKEETIEEERKPLPPLTDCTPMRVRIYMNSGETYSSSSGEAITYAEVKRLISLIGTHNTATFGTSTINTYFIEAFYHWRADEE